MRNVLVVVLLSGISISKTATVNLDLNTCHDMRLIELPPASPGKASGVACKALIKALFQKKGVSAVPHSCVHAKDSLW